MDSKKKAVELVVGLSGSYHPSREKLSVRLRTDERASIRDAIKDAGFREGDLAVLVGQEYLTALEMFWANAGGS